MRTTQNTSASTIQNGSMSSTARRSTDAKTARIAVATMIETTLTTLFMGEHHAI